ncbi:hypothetical protein D5086_033828 [Populus alba]|uniref:Uncharacterized protein n=1 Tax=Populus alba TaxID=43335 RepID=A0ACC4AHX5_POPAL
MNSKQPCQSEPDLPVPPLPALSVRSPSLSTAPTANRRVAIAVDLSDESAYAVKWAVQNYLRPGDAVILLHVRPTSALYGADWGSIQHQINNNKTPFDQNDPDSSDNQERQKLEDDFDSVMMMVKEEESVKIGGLGEEVEEGLHPVPEEDQEECFDDELKDAVLVRLWGISYRNLFVVLANWWAPLASISVTRNELSIDKTLGPLCETLDLLTLSHAFGKLGRLKSSMAMKLAERLGSAYRENLQYPKPYSQCSHSSRVLV